MELIEIIERDPELLALFDTGDDDGLLAALNAKTIEHRDPTVYQPADLLPLFGEVIGNQLLTVLDDVIDRGNKIAGVFKHGFLNEGADFSRTVAQQLIDRLADHPDWPPEATAAIKTLGVRMISPVEAKHGEGLEAVQADIDAARVQALQQTLKNLINDRFNAVHAAIDAGDVTTEAQAIAKFGE